MSSSNLLALAVRSKTGVRVSINRAILGSRQLFRLLEAFLEYTNGRT
jgi:hypothetical protein